MDKKIAIIYVGITSFLITSLICIIFAKELFFKNSYVYAFEDYSFLTGEPNSKYTVDDVKTLNEIVTTSGYNISNNIFTAIDNDPQIIYMLDEKTVNRVTIKLNNEVSEDIDVKIYVDTGDGFTPTDFYASKLVKGQRIIDVDIKKASYNRIRVDIGDVQGVEFELEKIILFYDEYVYNSYLSVFKIECIFFIIFYLLYYFNIKAMRIEYERLYKEGLDVYNG